MAGPFTVTIDLGNCKKGVPLMPGDIGYDEYAGTLSVLGHANLAPIGDAAPGTFRYIRIHNLFTSADGDGRGARDAGGDPVRIQPDGSTRFDWTIIDGVCQSLLDVGCTPFLELGFTPTPWSSMEERMAMPREEMPEELTYKIGRSPGSISSYPPRDNDEWAGLLAAFFAHLQEKFGKGALAWPCELWNEPDIGYFKGTTKEYCELWKVTWDTAKKAGMKTIGGPGIAGSLPFLKEFLEYCVDRGYPPDFISFHVKGGNSKTMVANMMQMWSRIVQCRDQVPVELEHVPLWITEFDPIVGCENGIVDGPKWAFHNTSYYASWLGKACHMLSLLQHSTWYGEAEPDPDIGSISFDAIFNDGHHITAESSPFYGARNMTTPVWVEALPGECNHDPLADIKKKVDIRREHPSLAAMLQDLKERQYKPDNDDRYIIKSLKKPIFRAFEYVTFLKGGNIPFSVASRDLFGVVTVDGESINFLACVHNDEMEVEQPIDVKFILDLGNFHHGAGEWKVEASARIDHGSSNPYETWLTMDSPFDLDRDQYKLLKQSTNPKPAALAGMMQGDEYLEFSLHMEGHSFNFIRFARSR